MYHYNVLSTAPDAIPVPYMDSSNFQMYQIWDGSYFAVPANSAVKNTAPSDQTPVSPDSDIKTNPATQNKRIVSIPLQNVVNYPLFPNNQFVPLLPNMHTCIPNVHTASLSEGITSNPSVPHLYQPMYHGVSPAPSLDDPPTPLSSQYISRLSPISSNSVPLPVTPTDQRTISFTSPTESSPATENRFNDPFLMLDFQLPLDTSLNNLQEMLSLDQYTKNTSKSMELSPITEAPISVPSQYVLPKPSPSIQIVPRLHNRILPNLSPAETSPYSTNQITITAREHSLKMKLNQLAKRNPVKVNELSYFLQSQSAQIELHRLQQLTEAAYPHYKEWLNNDCDSQLHQLMDRVEVSLQVLEKCGKENKNERPRRKIAESVARVLEAWYQANAQHPYPTAETCEILASRTGMQIQQVRKWFSNKRCRSNVIQKRNEKKCIKELSNLMTMNSRNCDI